MSDWDKAYRDFNRALDAETRRAVRDRIAFAQRSGLDIADVLEDAGWLATPRIVSEIEVALFDDLIGMVENLSTRELFGHDEMYEDVLVARINFKQFLRKERDRHIHPNG